MQLPVFPILFTLILHIIPDGVFISISATARQQIPVAPELPSPEFLFYLRVIREYLPGSYAFDQVDNFTRRMVWCALHQEVHMIKICTYLLGNECNHISALS